MRAGIGRPPALAGLVAIAGMIALVMLPAHAHGAPSPVTPGIGPEVWGFGMGEGAIVAVVDSRMHPREAGVRALPEIRLVESNRPGSHAARVAAILARRVGPRYGIAPGARILPIAVWEQGPTHPIADGVRWAVAAGAHVINLSQPLHCGTTVGLPAAVDAAERRGIPVVWSAGNTGRPIGERPDCLTPEQRSRLIITTSSRGNRLAREASYGGATMLAAPGITYGMEQYNFASMAAPVVSGTIALMRQARPRLTPAQIRRVLCRTARPVSGTRCGILRPYWALRAIARPRTPPVLHAASRRGDMVRLLVRAADAGRLTVLAPRCRRLAGTSVRRGRTAQVRLRCRGERRLRWHLAPEKRLRWKSRTGTAAVR